MGLVFFFPLAVGVLIGIPKCYVNPDGRWPAPAVLYENTIAIERDAVLIEHDMKRLVCFSSHVNDNQVGKHALLQTTVQRGIARIHLHLTRR